MTSTQAQFDTSADYLKSISKDICADNGCTEEEHVCESYAYIDLGGIVQDVCASDYWRGSPALIAAIPMPFDGSGEELVKAVEEDIFG